MGKPLVPADGLQTLAKNDVNVSWQLTNQVFYRVFNWLVEDTYSFWLDFKAIGLVVTINLPAGS